MLRTTDTAGDWYAASPDGEQWTMQREDAHRFAQTAAERLAFQLRLDGKQVVVLAWIDGIGWCSTQWRKA